MRQASLRRPGQLLPSADMPALRSAFGPTDLAVDLMAAKPACGSASGSRNIKPNSDVRTDVAGNISPLANGRGREWRCRLPENWRRARLTHQLPGSAISVVRWRVGFCGARSGRTAGSAGWLSARNGGLSEIGIRTQRQLIELDPRIPGRRSVLAVGYEDGAKLERIASKRIGGRGPALPSVRSRRLERLAGHFDRWSSLFVLAPGWAGRCQVDGTLCGLPVRLLPPAWPYGGATRLRLMSGRLESR